jgi:release factor glutamine methyltransferase
LKVGEAIAASGIDVREARLLLAEACGFSQASLAASPGQEIPFEVENAFFTFAERRKKGEPVAYILGRKEFYGLGLSVNPSVLVPRPETELLVDLALERIKERALGRVAASMLDLGTGSGAIGIAVKFNRPETRVVAVDADLSALLTAKRNAGRRGALRADRLQSALRGERRSAPRGPALRAAGGAGRGRRWP